MPLGSDEKHYTYTIITTDNSKQLGFLHDRMPVILENGSNELRTWLDPKRSEWTKELQSLLKPYDKELECYPVNKDVGKVGNNSPDFIVPVDSSQNKSNIANFFANSKKSGEKANSGPAEQTPSEVWSQPQEGSGASSQIEKGNKPLKRKHDEETVSKSPRKAPKTQPDASLDQPKSPPRPMSSPEKLAAQKKLRSSTSNGTASKSSPVKNSSGSQKITNFFGK